MNNWKTAWKSDKLKTLLDGLWLITVFSAFWGDSILSVTVPVLGELFPFRMLLPITALVFVIWSVAKRQAPWRGNTPVEWVCLVLIGVMLIGGAASLPIAIDRAFTFRRLFNLCFDLCFFFLMLRLCRDKALMDKTMGLSLLGLGMLSVLGVLECLFGPIFYTGENIQYIYLFGWRVASPMATFSNTNDFVTALVFLSVALLIWLLGKKQPQKKEWRAILVIACVFYYLIQCASARLLAFAVWLLVLALGLYAWNKNRRRAIALFALLAVFLGFSLTKTFNLRGVVADGLSLLEAGEHNGLSWQEQFFESGEDGLQLSAEHSAGVRGRLLVHVGDCLSESYGLGVGLGNTEQLARSRAVAKDGKIWAIHCFLARIVSDYGVFILLPLLALVFFLMKPVLVGLKKGKGYRGNAAVYAAACIGFVLISTASADAQDILPMWMFIAVMVLTCRPYFAKETEECSL